ncbi:hypothetical protein TCT1_08900 [Xenorhabdus sp. TCT-1]|uniref:Uncharacterized protein n=1 Tax=Xenorhabdus taiwanensis TaxID=3085177 RepID=A0ABM8JUB6_9GAMM|nr:hypothetical protein TCT1_08900 [Xenorhabdus sp. TCT-1]
MMAGFCSGKCAGHIIGWIGFQNIVLDGVAHDGSDALTQPLGDIVFALFINGFDGG